MYAGVTLRRTNAPGPLSDVSHRGPPLTIERSAARIAAPVKAEDAEDMAAAAQRRRSYPERLCTHTRNGCRGAAGVARGRRSPLFHLVDVVHTWPTSSPCCCWRPPRRRRSKPSPGSLPSARRAHVPRRRRVCASSTRAARLTSPRRSRAAACSNPPTASPLDSSARSCRTWARARPTASRAVQPDGRRRAVAVLDEEGDAGPRAALAAGEARDRAAAAACADGQRTERHCLVIKGVKPGEPAESPAKPMRFVPTAAANATSCRTSSWTTSR